jgi:hypothetical protein
MEATGSGVNGVDGKGWFFDFKSVVLAAAKFPSQVSNENLRSQKD